MSIDTAINIINTNLITACTLLDTLNKELDNNQENIDLQNAVKSAEYNVRILTTTLTSINNAKLSIDVTRIVCLKYF